ncbi:MAG: BatD family protein [Elusimicrobiota bacterium]|jgi:hypothetical protein|nr:BatD family protein [Elusimicrobiota bacterium]
MLKKILLFLSLLFAPIGVFADDITISASANKNSVPLNGTLIYSVTISGAISNFPEPQIRLNEFNVFATGRSQSMSIINGKASGSVSYNYTIGPKSIGQFSIPPASVRYNNKVYSTESINIEVVPPVQNPQAQNAPQQPQRTAVQQRGGAGRAFVRASVDKKTVYENEKLVYRFKFYTNMPLAANPEYIAPDFSGFWNDGSIPKNGEETVDGVRVSVSGLETVLYPISAGEKTIAPARLKVAVRDFSVPDNIDSFMAQFFSGSGGTQVRELSSNQIKITVLPLPKEGRPANFFGAVGDFKISAEVDKTEVQTNSPITLTLAVTGNANMKSVSKLDFALDSGLRKYDTIVSETSMDKKVFTAIIIPMTPGEKIIPQIELSYFNPKTKRYETARSQSIKITAVGDAAVQDYYAGAQTGERVQTDINFIKQIDDLRQNGGNYIEDKKFYIVFAPFILLFIGAFMFKFFKEKKTSKNEKTKNSQFNQARKYIEKAENEISKDNIGGVYDLIYSALIESISAVCKTKPDSLQIPQAFKDLEEKNIDAEALKAVKDIFEKLNLYKFASVRADEKSLKQMLESVKDIIDKFKN